MKTILKDNVGKFFKNKYKPPVSNSNAPDQAYTDGAIAEEAIRLIDRLSSDKNPFFLLLASRDLTCHFQHLRNILIYTTRTKFQ